MKMIETYLVASAYWLNTSVLTNKKPMKAPRTKMYLTKKRP